MKCCVPVPFNSIVFLIGYAIVTLQQLPHNSGKSVTVRCDSKDYF